MSLSKTYEWDSRGRLSERIRKGFCPDFLIHGTPDWPQLHVEITGARCRSGKINRMILTRRHYRIHTVLIIVGSRQWKRIERDPGELLRILQRAGKRAQTLAETYEPAA